MWFVTVPAGGATKHQCSLDVSRLFTSHWAARQDWSATQGHHRRWHQEV